MAVIGTDLVSTSGTLGYADQIKTVTNDGTSNSVNQALAGQNITASFQNNTLTLNKGGTELVTVDVGGGSAHVWDDLASLMFSGAEAQDIQDTGRVEYDPGYSRGIDWRDMSQSTTINENRFRDAALTVSVTHAAFTVTGFGENTLRKVYGLHMQRNDAQSGDGAMMEIGFGNPFLRVDSTNNRLQVNRNLDFDAPDWTDVLAGGLNVTLGPGDNEQIIMEMVKVIPSDPDTTRRWEVLIGTYDGTNYQECSNISVTLPDGVDGDNVGFSRSTAQRGQILSFKAINSPGYLFHSRLDDLLRHHRDDFWVYGFARRFGGGTFREVSFNSRLDLADRSTVNGQFISSRGVRTVLSATEAGDAVTSVTLPTDYLTYSEMVITAHSDVTNETIARVFDIDAFRVMSITNDPIRLAGATDLAFDPDTRILSTTPTTTVLYTVELIRFDNTYTISS